MMANQQSADVQMHAQNLHRFGKAQNDAGNLEPFIGGGGSNEQQQALVGKALAKMYPSKGGKPNKHNPTWKAELSEALENANVAKLQELIGVVTDQEMSALAEQVAARLEEDGADADLLLQAMMNHSKMPAFDNRDTGRLVVLGIKHDRQDFARFLVMPERRHHNYDARQVAVAMDQCLVNNSGDGKLLQHVDLFMGEHMPDVESVINANMRKQKEKEAATNYRGPAE